MLMLEKVCRVRPHPLDNSEESACEQALFEIVLGIGPEAYKLYVERRAEGKRRAPPRGAERVGEAPRAVGRRPRNLGDAGEETDLAGKEALVPFEIGGAGAEAASEDAAAARHAKLVASAFTLLNETHPLSSRWHTHKGSRAPKIPFFWGCEKVAP